MSTNRVDNSYFLKNAQEAKAPDGVSPVFRVLLNSWRRSLLAENRAPRTVQTYLEALTKFGGFLVDQGMPSDVASIHREHVEAFIAHLLACHKPATAANRYRSLQCFFRWALEEGEIKESPMQHCKPPHVPQEPPDVLTEEQLRRLIKICEGKAYEDRRDMAIIRLLLDTGIRRAEIAGLTIEDVDLDQSAVFVMGKGRRPRSVPFGRKTAQALDRYLRARAGHRDAALPNFWLGRGGPMTDSGIFQVVTERAKVAGIESVFLHQFRHTFAHSYLADGGNEGDLMMLCGWRSREMLDRYGASAKVARAHEAYKKHSPGDRL